MGLSGAVGGCCQRPALAHRRAGRAAGFVLPAAFFAVRPLAGRPAPLFDVSSSSVRYPAREHPPGAIQGHLPPLPRHSFAGPVPAEHQRRLHLAAVQPLDPRRLGVLGTSLGSFLAALAGEMEPRLGRVAVLLGGGGLVDGYYDHPQAAPYRRAYEALGGTKERLVKLLAPVDPLTCAANLKDRKVLMMAARNDEIVPPRMAQALWEASGRQKIVWYPCGHYTAALYFLPALEQIATHLKE